MKQEEIVTMLTGMLLAFFVLMNTLLFLLSFNSLFDSQNNNRGGYNVGSLYYYAGSILPIEWTNQHSCGDPNNNCEIVFQYMCDDNLRDGASTK